MLLGLPLTPNEQIQNWVIFLNFFFFFLPPGKHLRIPQHELLTSKSILLI